MPGRSELIHSHWQSALINRVGKMRNIGQRIFIFIILIEYLN